jgi:hypothetical protein
MQSVSYYSGDKIQQNDMGSECTNSERDEKYM